MHEISLIKNIMDIVKEYDTLNKVDVIVLEIGIYSAISISQLKHAFNLYVIDTKYQDTNLIIKRSKGKRFCNDCHQEYFFTLKNPQCPTCLKVSNTITGGYELRILEIEGE